MGSKRRRQHCLKSIDLPQISRTGLADVMEAIEGGQVTLKALRLVTFNLAFAIFFNFLISLILVSYELGKSIKFVRRVRSIVSLWRAG